MYIATIGSVVGRLNIMGRINEAWPLLQRLEKISPTNRKEAMWHFIETERNFTLYFMNTGQLQAALDREQGVMAGLRKYGTSVPHSSRITFLYNLGVCYMFTDNHRKAAAYFDRIRQLGILSDRLDLQGMARLIRLLLLWQNDAQGGFLHYLRNSKRFFKKDHGLYELEQDIYHWLLEPDRAAVPINEQRGALATLATRMQVHLEKRRVGAEEVMLWATATSQGRPLNSVFLERLALQ
jgi:tetratricopeptide (TPR) repeat protein